MKKFPEIEKTFRAVYAPMAKAIGDCLLTLKPTEVDATAVICAIIGVAVDITANAIKLADEQGKSELAINADQIARFSAITIASTLPVSGEVRIALDKVVMAGLAKPGTTPGGGVLN